MQNPLGSAETEASVFLSVCSWSGITDLKLQLSLAFKDGFIWRLQRWVTLPRESGLLLHQALLSGSSVVWRSDGPRGISVTNASSLSLKVRTNGVWGFFHLAAIFLQRKHLSIGLSLLPFLIMSDPVTVRLEKPLTHPHASLSHWEVPLIISKQ